jgi:two-component system osmolarity sensor histidine kinase EnvZ
MFGYLKNLMPRGLYGRAILILVVPVVTIQLVVSVAFIQRHFERVTEQMTTSVALEIEFLRDQLETAPDLSTAQRLSQQLATALEMEIAFPQQQAMPGDVWEFWDLSGRAVISTLRSRFPDMVRAELTGRPRVVRLAFDGRHGPLEVTIARSRMSASNPHQLLVLMIVTSILMTLIAIAFMRNQLRPIKQLGEAAAAFGKGHHQPYRARGATEVRAAGSAFLTCGRGSSGRSSSARCCCPGSAMICEAL